MPLRDGTPAALAAPHLRQCCLGITPRPNATLALCWLSLKSTSAWLAGCHSTSGSTLSCPTIRNAAMAQWLKRLTRNQMGSSSVGLNPICSGDSYLLWPDRTMQLPHGPTPPPTKALQYGALLSRLGVSSSTPCQPCSSWRSVAHLAVKSWLVPAVTNATCATSRCSW